MRDVRSIVSWLVEGAPGAATPVATIAQMGPALRDAGVPVEHIGAFVRTLHPHIMGRRFFWQPGKPVRVCEASYQWLEGPEFRGSPIARVIETGDFVRLRAGEAAGHALDADGLDPATTTDYLGAPLRFIGGQVHAVSFATSAPDGFSDEDIAAIRSVISPLARMAEIFALHRTAANLLNTYVGHNAGERIMAGNIKRGDTDVLHAVIWFSDLRGFTALADQVSPVELIAMLNHLFETQVPAIEREGGEVLKFMGDGLLAVFAITDGGNTAKQQCEVAARAARAAFEALRVFNAAQTSRGERTLRFGLALHVGHVTYGNIGGSGRLDFTCIGAAINVAARLEALTSALGRSLVVSADFARESGLPVTSLGGFALKGVAVPQEVFSLDEP